jgi:hypothetical protein
VDNRDIGNDPILPCLKWLWCKFTGLPTFQPFWCVEGGKMAGFLGLDKLFEGRHFDREIIVLCVRWCLRFKLRVRA